MDDLYASYHHSTTDDMKKSVQQDGQALFEIFGIGSATAVGANAVSDSMKNNTISQKTN